MVARRNGSSWCVFRQTFVNVPTAVHHFHRWPQTPSSYTASSSLGAVCGIEAMCDMLSIQQLARHRWEFFDYVVAPGNDSSWCVFPPNFSNMSPEWCVISVRGPERPSSCKASSSFGVVCGAEAMLNMLNRTVP